MTIEEILQGESKYVEFKASLPKRSETYIKTMIAFANTSGGSLIIGIDDSRFVVGVDKDTVFQIMDAIANTVSDSCEPQIIPDISFQTIEGKCIIIVEIYPGTNRPYYLKHIGKENGTYIRVAGTSRQADAVKIKELELEGTHSSWDEQICIGYEVKAEAIDKLCHDIHMYMMSAVESAEEKKNIPMITEEHLLNWRLLRKTGNQLQAANAFVLLTSDYFRFAKIQCALFKGCDRDEFLDKKEYSGPLYEQIEEAYRFVLRHINRSAEINGLVRKEKYELPVGAVREMIINAQCHRNFMDTSCVQVALFDDRLEITSPGMLYGGLTLQEALHGRSKIRNKAIAEVFNRMELIEGWGTGIRRIMKRAKEYELPIPDFLEIGDTFRVNLYRKDSKKPLKADKKPLKADKKPLYENRRQLITKYVSENGRISNREARQLLNLAESTTKRILKPMVLDGYLIEQGEKKSRIYLPHR